MKNKEYYNRISNRYDGNILKHPYEAYRFGEITRGIATLIPKKKGLRVLDLGCGTGTFNIPLIEKKIKNAKIVGVDISKDMIKIAKKRFPKHTFSVGDAHKLPFKDNSFDLVISREVLEHVENPVKVLKEVNRVTKDSGKVIISTPSWFGLIGPLYFIKKNLGTMQPIDNWWTPYSLKSAFNKARLKITNMKSTNPIPYHKKLPNVFIPLVKSLDRILTRRPFRNFGRILIVEAKK